MVPGASALKSKCPKCAKPWSHPLRLLGQGVPSREQLVTTQLSLGSLCQSPAHHLSAGCGPCGVAVLCRASCSSPFAPHLDCRGLAKQNYRGGRRLERRGSAKVAPTGALSLLHFDRPGRGLAFPFQPLDPTPSDTAYLP